MQGLVKTCLEMCAVDLTEVCSTAFFKEGSMQLGLSIGVAAELETGWNLQTKSRRDKCSSELRNAKTENPDSKPAEPMFLKLHNNNIGKSHQLEFTENTVITTRSHFTFVVRECFEQMHRGDHFIFEHPSNASSWNEVCVQKLVALPSVLRVKGPMCRWHLLSGESGFIREPQRIFHTWHRRSNNGLKMRLEQSATGTCKCRVDWNQLEIPWSWWSHS